MGIEARNLDGGYLTWIAADTARAQQPSLSSWRKRFSDAPVWTKNQDLVPTTSSHFEVRIKEAGGILGTHRLGCVLAIHALRRTGQSTLLSTTA